MSDSTSAISFFNEDIALPDIPLNKVISWITNTVISHGYKPSAINYIFCSDKYLPSINIKYLDHDYFTDIITFDNSESQNEIEADIFISLDRVQENSSTHDVTFTQELLRVISHGVLHLVGFDDKSEEDKTQMRQEEENCLQSWSTME